MYEMEARDYELPNATDMQKKQVIVVATFRINTRQLNILSFDIAHIGVPSSGCSSVIQPPHYFVKKTRDKILEPCHLLGPSIV
jgi:hypothetical protein